jgi:hypothetical protein
MADLSNEDFMAPKSKSSGKMSKFTSRLAASKKLKAGAPSAQPKGKDAAFHASKAEYHAGQAKKATSDPAIAEAHSDLSKYHKGEIAGTNGPDQHRAAGDAHSTLADFHTSQMVQAGGDPRKLARHDELRQEHTAAADEADAKAGKPTIRTPQVPPGGSKNPGAPPPPAAPPGPPQVQHSKPEGDVKQTPINPKFLPKRPGSKFGQKPMGTMPPAPGMTPQTAPLPKSKGSKFKAWASSGKK